MIFVVLTNAVDGPAFILLQGLFKIIEKVTKEKEKFELEPDSKLPKMDEIVGYYYCDWGTSLFSQIGSKLVLIGPGSPNPGEFMQIFDHKENYTFTAPKEPYNASPGQEIEFIKDKDDEMIFIDSHKGKSFRFYFDY